MGQRVEQENGIKVVECAMNSIVSVIFRINVLRELGELMACVLGLKDWKHVPS